MVEMVIECFGYMIGIKECKNCPEYKNCLDSGWLEDQSSKVSQPKVKNNGN